MPQPLKRLSDKDKPEQCLAGSDCVPKHGFPQLYLRSLSICNSKKWISGHLKLFKISTKILFYLLAIKSSINTDKIIKVNILKFDLVVSLAILVHKNVMAMYFGCCQRDLFQTLHDENLRLLIQSSFDDLGLISKSLRCQKGQSESCIFCVCEVLT